MVCFMSAPVFGDQLRSSMATRGAELPKASIWLLRTCPPLLAIEMQTLRVAMRQWGHDAATAESTRCSDARCSEDSRCGQKGSRNKIVGMKSMNQPWER